MIIEISWGYKKMDNGAYQRKVLSFKHQTFLSFQLPLIMIIIETYDSSYSTNAVWADAIYVSGQIFRCQKFYKEKYIRKISGFINKVVNYYGENAIYPYL